MSIGKLQGDNYLLISLGLGTGSLPLPLVLPPGGVEEEQDFWPGDLQGPCSSRTPEARLSLTLTPGLEEEQEEHEEEHEEETPPASGSRNGVLLSAPCNRLTLCIPTSCSVSCIHISNCLKTGKRNSQGVEISV